MTPRASLAHTAPGFFGLTLEKRLLAGVCSTVVVLLVAACSFAQLSSFRASNRRVNHSLETIDALHEVERTLIDTETGQRGYLVTGDRGLLAPYERGSAQVAGELDDVRRLIDENPAQQERFQALERDIRAKLGLLGEALQLQEGGSRSAAVAAVRGGEDQRAMAKVRGDLEGMIGAEQGELDAGRARQDHDFRLTTLIIAGGSLFAFCFGFAANLGIRRGVFERKRDQEVIAEQMRQIEVQTAVLVENEHALAQRLEELGVVNRQLDEQVHGLTAAKIETERALRELRASSTALEKANWDLDQFAYAASHDLKAPLRGIASVSDWLEEDLGPALTPKAKEQLRLLHGRVHRMEALIDGILAYSRASRSKDRLEPIEVAPFLRELCDLLSLPPELVTIDVPETMAPFVVQHVPFQQVWMNLISNAIKHGAREGARIRLGARDVGEGLEFWVSDNGPGIEPRYHERVFRMFHTLASRDKVEGAGIGLAIVKKLVEDRGGRIWIESEAGKGAKFHFLWPKSELPPRTTAVPASCPLSMSLPHS